MRMREGQKVRRNKNLAAGICFKNKNLAAGICFKKLLLLFKCIAYRFMIQIFV